MTEIDGNIVISKETWERYKQAEEDALRKAYEMGKEDVKKPPTRPLPSNLKAKLDAAATETERRAILNTAWSDWEREKAKEVVLETMKAAGLSPEDL